MDHPSATVDEDGLIGSTPAIAAVREAIARLAPNPFTILIYGETGAGKELVARALHRKSPRRDGPFIAVNCAALVDSLLEAELFGIEDRAATGVQGRPGKFELADRGTLFLDEVADLSGRAQVALLRVLEDHTIERVGGHRSRRVDTRVIVATNRLLEDLVERRQFRDDLFYRLTGIDIWLPSLRERPADIPALVAHFLQLHGDQERTVLPAVMEVFCRYPWPGNVRELERVVQRCLTAAPDADIGLDALPQRLSSRQHRPHVTPLVDPSLRACAVRHVQAVLQECQGDKGLACRRLGITYRTLRNYLGVVATRARLA